MSKKFLLTAAVFAFYGWPAFSSCVASNGSYSDVGEVYINITAGARNMAAGGVTTIQRGLTQWNEGTPCFDLSQPQPFSHFNTAGQGPRVDIVRFDGHSVLFNQGYACASYDSSSRQISLYTKIPHPDYPNDSSEDLDCDWSNPSKVEDVIAHELGHVLGLDHPGTNCSGYIMGGAWYTIVGNVAVDVTPDRTIRQEECDLADENSITPDEDAWEEYQCQWDPNCDPYAPCAPNCGSPVLVDLDRNGFLLSGLDDPVRFDIDADGVRETMAWTRSDQRDGLLCRDRNENGSIDDGGELFGDATQLNDGTTASHGYEALAELDRFELGGNGDRRFTREDAAYSTVKVWVDRDHDGVADPDEVTTLKENRIVELEITYRRVDRYDDQGNWFGYVSAAWIDMGPRLKRVPTVDVFFLTMPRR